MIWDHKHCSVKSMSVMFLFAVPYRAQPQGSYKYHCLWDQNQKQAYCSVKRAQLQRLDSGFNYEIM